jgi:nucleoid DNA-binding protein
MDKPVSMSVKDYLIRTLAVKILTSEKTIEAVVNHQFQSANEALDTNNSVEISGFGKLFFNNKKAIKRLGALNAKREVMERMINDETLPEQKRKSAQVTLNQTNTTIGLLKARITYED